MLKKKKDAVESRVKLWRGKKKDTALDESPKTEAGVETTAEGEAALTPEQEKSAKRFKRKKTVKKWIKRVIGIILLLALIGGIIWFVKFKNSRKETEAPVQTTSVVTRGSIDSRITGSGTVQPIESYTLTSLIEGKILASPYDEGDLVNEGDVLYRFDDTEAQTRIQKAQSALRIAQNEASDAAKESARAVETEAKNVQSAQRGVEKAERALEDAREEVDKINERMGSLVVRAPISGEIEELSARPGDDVSGVLCTVADYGDISTPVSFNGVQIQQINVGDRVSVGVPSLMASVGGVVEKKFSTPHPASNGTIMYSVKIKIDGGSVLASGTNVSVTVHTSSGDVECPSSGLIVYAEPEEVKLEEAGEVVEILTENGRTVSAGAVIARLRSDSLEKELENAQTALEDARIALRDANDALKNANEDYADAVEKLNSEISNDAVKDAQTELDNAVKAAEDYVIKSPVTGVVLEKHYKAGDNYGSDNSEKNLMVVADMTTMVFTINVDELDIANIQVGQSVNIMADALPADFFMGTVTNASKIGSAENGVSAYPVEITVTEPGNLMSGMNVTAEIVVGFADDVLIAPASAVFMMGGQYFATVVTTAGDGTETEEQVPVTVGLHNESFYEIVDGLNEGDVLRDSGISGGDDMGGMMMYGW